MYVHGAHTVLHFMETRKKTCMVSGCSGTLKGYACHAVVWMKNSLVSGWLNLDIFLAVHVKVLSRATVLVSLGSLIGQWSLSQYTCTGRESIY